jgi:hypothetical protein
MLALPTGTLNSLFFPFSLSTLLCKETAKKYLHNSKCGSIPRNLSHNTIKAVMS